LLVYTPDYQRQKALCYFEMLSPTGTQKLDTVHNSKESVYCAAGLSSSYKHFHLDLSSMQPSAAAESAVSTVVGDVESKDEEKPEANSDITAGTEQATNSGLPADKRDDVSFADLRIACISAGDNDSDSVARDTPANCYHVHNPDNAEIYPVHDPSTAVVMATRMTVATTAPQLATAATATMTATTTATTTARVTTAETTAALVEM
jgi:hypothetical protein